MIAVLGDGIESDDPRLWCPSPQFVAARALMGGGVAPGQPSPPVTLAFEAGAGTLWRAAERIAWRQGVRDRLRTGKE